MEGIPLEGIYSMKWWINLKAGGLIVIIGEVYAFFGKVVVTFILVQQSKFPHIANKPKNNSKEQKMVWFCKMHLLLLMLPNNFTE